MLIFWFDKGVDGFRVDVVFYFVEDLKFFDEFIKFEYDFLCFNYDYLEYIYMKNLWDNYKIV